MIIYILLGLLASVITTLGIIGLDILLSELKSNIKLRKINHK